MSFNIDYNVYTIFSHRFASGIHMESHLYNYSMVKSKFFMLYADIHSCCIQIHTELEASIFNPFCTQHRNAVL